MGDEMEKKLDQLSRSMAGATSRRQALKIMGAGIAGSALFAKAASAAPQTCITCSCGTGRPCNVKETICEVRRTFESEVQQCTEACSRANLNFCGSFQAFHCPHGTADCPA
jgi:hypothetical protein